MECRSHKVSHPMGSKEGEQMNVGDLVKVKWKSRRWGETPFDPVTREFLGIVGSESSGMPGAWNVIITEIGTTRQFSASDLEIISESPGNKNS